MTKRERDRLKLIGDIAPDMRCGVCRAKRDVESLMLKDADGTPAGRLAVTRGTRAGKIVVCRSCNGRYWQ